MSRHVFYPPKGDTFEGDFPEFLPLHSPQMKTDSAQGVSYEGHHWLLPEGGNFWLMDRV